MPTKTHSAAFDLYHDKTDDQLALLCDKNDDRPPLKIEAPIIVALSLLLWAGIGFVVSALL